jgi:hypothetical protein
MTTFVATRSGASGLVLIGHADDPAAECARLSEGHPFTVVLQGVFPQLQREELAAAFPDDLGHGWVAATLLDIWAALAHTELHSNCDSSEDDSPEDSPPAKRRKYTDKMGWTVETCPKDEAPLASEVRKLLKSFGGLPLYKALTYDLRRLNFRKGRQTVKIFVDATGQAVRPVAPEPPL